MGFGREGGGEVGLGVVTRVSSALDSNATFRPARTLPTHRINMFRACYLAVPVSAQNLDEQPPHLYLLRSFGDVHILKSYLRILGINVAKGIPRSLGASSRRPSLKKDGPGCHLWFDYCSPHGEGPQMARSIASASSMEWLALTKDVLLLLFLCFMFC